MSLNIQKNPKHDFYSPKALIKSGAIVLPKNKLSQMDDLNNVVLTYASLEQPKPVHGYDVDKHEITNQVIGYRIWCIQHADPFQVTVAETNLPEMSFGVTKFKLQNLRGMYSRHWQKHFYRADSLELVPHES